MKNGLDSPRFRLGTGHLVMNNDDELLISGGNNRSESFYNTSQLIGINTSGIFQSFPVSRHCNIRINESHYLVTGGKVPCPSCGPTGSIKVTKLTYICQTNFGKCLPGPPLNRPRRAHGCSQVWINGSQYFYLYVTGGYVGIDPRTNFSASAEVEVLHDVKEWVIGIILKVGLCLRFLEKI